MAGVALATGCAALPGAVAPAHAADAPVVLEHLSFHRGRITVEMPRVEAQGTTLSADELRDILDPSSSLELGQRLTRLSAASISAPEVTIRKDPASGTGTPETVTIHDVLLTDVQAGKVGALAVRGVDAAVRTGGEERDTIAVGSIAANGLDPQLALQIATGSRTDRDLPVSPVLRNLAIDGVKLTNGKAQVLRLDRLETGALEGRPFLDRPADLVRKFEESPETLSPFPTNPLFVTLVDAATSLRLQRFKLSGAAFDGGKDGFRVGTFLLNGLGSPGLPIFEIDDFGFDAEGVHLSMKSAVVSGTGSSAVFATAAAQLTGQTLAVPASPPIPDAAGGVALDVTDVHMAIPNTDDDGPFPPGTVNVIDIPSYTAGESATAGGTSAETHSKVEARYTIPPGGGDQTIQNFRDMGLSPLDMTFGYRITYDLKGHAVRLDEFSLGGVDIGSITLAGRVADMPDAPFRQGLPPDALKEKFDGVTFRDFTATLVDKGFMGRALPVLARQGGTSAALMKAGLKTQVDLNLPGLLGQTPTEAAVAKAIDGFIDAGGTLVLSAIAPKGVTLRDIAATPDPTTLLGRVDVTATNHP